MAGCVDALIAQVLRLAINLQACRARLAARTDGEALHDLRFALRKLHSLLPPLRGLIENDPLESAAALGHLKRGAIGRATGAYRAAFARRAPLGAGRRRTTGGSGAVAVAAVLSRPLT